MNYPRNLMKYLGGRGRGVTGEYHSQSTLSFDLLHLSQLGKVRILAVDLDPVLERGGGYIDSLVAIGLIAG